MSKEKNLSIFTAIAYANGKPHIGHAYEYVLADCFARYNRIWNPKSETFFCTGMDEHGQKIYEKSIQENKTQQEFVDEYSDLFKKLDQKLSISYDYFIRTTDENHKKTAQKVWQKLFQNGDLYEKEYEGLYCVGCESFKTEKDLNEKGECPDHLKVPNLTKEKNWFFKLSKYENFLKENIQNNKIQILPEYRKNEMSSFIENGLQDISFSRSKELMNWGIEIPGDSSQVMYVWCDALVNYISACDYLSESERFNQAWQETTKVQVIGKDILRFHSLYWPAMLKSLEIALPDKILVHGHITSGGQKMSKTIGNIIDPEEVVDIYNNFLQEKSILGNSLGSEFFRYFVLKNISVSEDGDVTFERMQELYNGDLSSGIGNLLSRCMKLFEKYLEVKEFFEQIQEPEIYKEYFKALDSKSAFEYVFALIKEADKFMQEKEPFKVIKVDEKLGREYLEDLRIKVYTIARLLNPFMPITSEIIKKIIKENKMPEKSLFPKYE